MYDASGLEVKNTPLQSFYDSHNGRLPTATIPSIGDERKPFKDVLQEYIDRMEENPNTKLIFLPREIGKKVK